MRALYLIIGAVMIYMFVFVANEVDLGVAGPILSAGFFGVFIYCLFLFAMDWRQSHKKPDEQAEFRMQLHKLMNPPKQDSEYRPRRRRGSRREY